MDVHSAPRMLSVRYDMICERVLQSPGVRRLEARASRPASELRHRRPVVSSPGPGSSAVRLARSVRDAEVGGSNPLSPTAPGVAPRRSRCSFGSTHHADARSERGRQSAAGRYAPPRTRQSRAPFARSIAPDPLRVGDRGRARDGGQHPHRRCPDPRRAGRTRNRPPRALRRRATRRRARSNAARVDAILALERPRLRAGHQRHRRHHPHQSRPRAGQRRDRRRRCGRRPRIPCPRDRTRDQRARRPHARDRRACCAR